jgi:signal transduction histidine kinase
MERRTEPLTPARLKRCLASGIVTSLLTLLFAVVIAFLIPLLVPVTNGTLLFLLIFGVLLVFAVLRGRLSSILEAVLHPARPAYRQFAQRYGRTVQQMTDASHLYEFAARTLFSALGATHASVWLFQSEERVLTLAHFEGAEPADDLGDLPVDLEPTRLHAGGYVLALPECALRRGWMSMGVQLVHPVRWRDQLMGVIALGGARAGGRYDDEGLLLLEWTADQVALAVKSIQLGRELEETRTHLQLAYRQTVEVQEEERRALAAELHDDILGRLTTMGLTLHNCRKRVGDGDLQVGAWLEGLEKETYNVNQRLREITQGLHPTVLTDLGLISAIQAYLDYIARQPLPATAPHVITLTAQGFNGDRIPDVRLERDLYHITRQALDNAVAHAQADQVFVHFRWSNDSLSVTVQDTGRGMRDTPERLMGQRGHLGLLSMNERVRAWGGHLALDSATGRGTTVRASIPIAQPSRSPAHLQAYTHHLSRPARRVAAHNLSET